MRFISLFSGIEAASQAWLPLGWECVAVSEIEPFPCAVLAHHYPDVPNLGDVTKVTHDQVRALGHVDLVVGGFPCQDLSVAGKRAGLKHGDGTATRSGLFFDACRIARWSGARFVLVENVPGLFSSNAGRDFACVVGELAGCEFGVPPEGWGNCGAAVGPLGLVEWCVLDAQFFGLAQRRKRVFALLDTGNWRARPPVLLESESLRGDPAPRREARQGTAAKSLSSSDGGIDREDRHTLIAVTLQGGHGNSQVDGPKAVAFEPRFARNDRGGPEEICPPLKAQSGRTGKGDSAPCVAFAQNQREEVRELEVAGAVAGVRRGDAKNETLLAAAQVRRLTVKECARLQGFPDDYLVLKYADADEAHAAQILHELWRQAGTKAPQEQGRRAGDPAALLTPEILLAGVYGGWISWSMAADRAGESGALPGQEHRQEGFLRALRVAAQLGLPPYRRESFEQCARELGSDLSLVPHEGASARALLRSSQLWPQAQARWPLRYALATPKAGRSVDSLNPDGPRYKALGNSMAVPVMAHIGRRIAAVERLLAELAA